MQYGPEGRENTIFTATARFLLVIGVPVPGILAEDPGRGFVLLEDAGDADLWSFRDAPWEVRRALYGKALEAAFHLHEYPRPEEAAGRLGLMASFGPDLYRWGGSIFSNRSFPPSAVSGRPAGAGGSGGGAVGPGGADACGSALPRPPGLPVEERHDPWGRAGSDRFPGDAPRNPLYDLGSLLYDPYVPLNEDERMEMLFWYAGLGGSPEIAEDDASRFREASVQRLLQAMGAYGFLGLRKGKQEFLDHIPRGFLNLADAARRHGGFPGWRACSRGAGKPWRKGESMPRLNRCPVFNLDGILGRRRA